MTVVDEAPVSPLGGSLMVTLSVLTLSPGISRVCLERTMTHRQLPFLSKPLFAISNKPHSSSRWVTWLWWRGTIDRTVWLGWYVCPAYRSAGRCGQKPHSEICHCIFSSWLRHGPHCQNKTESPCMMIAHLSSLTIVFLQLCTMRFGNICKKCCPWWHLSVTKPFCKPCCLDPQAQWQDSFLHWLQKIKFSK